MSFARAVLIAFMAGEFASSSDPVEHLTAIAIAAAIWFGLTTDPLPAAVERGLQAFAKRYRND